MLYFVLFRLGSGAPTNVIVDNDSDDDDNNFMVEESAPPPVEPEQVCNCIACMS